MKTPLPLTLRYKPTVPQVYHTHWGDPTADKTYFARVDHIANIIGAQLVMPIAVSNYLEYGTTIHVQQAKEKFGCCRVYCTLAADELVQREWERQKPQPPLMDFVRQCLVRDARHYAATYAEVLDLLPQFHLAIVNAADYPILVTQSWEEAIELFESGYFSGAPDIDVLNVFMEARGWPEYIPHS